MTYQEFINDILQTRGRFIDSNEYHERHHIIPKCKDGKNDEKNLIDLFAREHFIAHKLLMDENPDDNQLAHAYTLMAFTKDKNQMRYELTPDEYEEARKVYADKFSGGNNPSAKRVIRLRDGKVYNTIQDCYIDNGFSNETMYRMLKIHREFVRYDEWVNMSKEEQEYIKSIDWKLIEHQNRSNAIKNRTYKTGRQQSKSTRKKIGTANKSKNAVMVYCVELNEEFNSIQEAAIKTNTNKTSIGYCLNGKQKHAGKHPVTGEKLTWVKLENKNC